MCMRLRKKRKSKREPQKGSQWRRRGVVTGLYVYGYKLSICGWTLFYGFVGDCVAVTVFLLAWVLGRRLVVFETSVCRVLERMSLSGTRSVNNV